VTVEDQPSIDASLTPASTAMLLETATCWAHCRVAAADKAKRLAHVAPPGGKPPKIRASTKSRENWVYHNEAQRAD
jgi:hypothetical protein